MVNGSVYVIYSHGWADVEVVVPVMKTNGRDVWIHFYYRVTKLRMMKKWLLIFKNVLTTHEEKHLIEPNNK